MKKLLCIVLGLLFYCHSAMAGDSTVVEEKLRSSLDAVFTILKQNDLDQTAKNKQIIEIVTPMFDFELMAKLSLGRKHWPGLSPEKKERFTELFVRRLKTSYLKNFTLYTNEEVAYETPRQVKKKIHIPTYLLSKDKKISILYKFFNKGNEWKIYDLEIQGVSIIQSYRSQFSQILEDGTIDDLLLKLETPADN